MSPIMAFAGVVKTVADIVATVGSFPLNIRWQNCYARQKNKKRANLFLITHKHQLI
jgi:hypothetical protein